MRRNTLLAATLAGAALLTLPGCLVTSSSASSYSGNRVEPGAESAIVLHRTTPDEAVATLGEPSAHAVTEDGLETMTWRWTKRESSRGSVFLIFGGSSKSTRDYNLTVRFRNGVAINKSRN